MPALPELAPKVVPEVTAPPLLARIKHFAGFNGEKCEHIHNPDPSSPSIR